MPAPRVFLAEKPSQGGDIARILGIAKRHEGYIETRSGDIVTWVIGHLLEQAQPNAYREEWSKWRWEFLPMVPDSWQHEVVKSKSKQLTVIKKALKSASEVVIATDAAREGELIAREVLEHLRYKGKTRRLWASALTDKALRDALSNLLPGSAKDALYQAALSRSHADWLYGMNLSRAATLSVGHKAPVGRVQTPVLSLVVKRDLEIENFVSSDYYELEAEVETASGHRLKLMHAPSGENRITDKALATKLKKQASGAQGPLRVKKTKGADGAPLPFKLPALQKVAASKLGLTAQQTLDGAQALYEAKVITYPRTDCAHLDPSLKDEVPRILAALQKMFPKQCATLESKGVTLRDSTFDASKLTDHHGIIPTGEQRHLTGAQAKLYELIAIRFMQAMAPDRRYNATRIEMDANGVLFLATGKEITEPGWSAIQIQ
ncbi:DNA topoisomerase [Thioalkalivibrio thiocyanodenitrificans]|uniref:DNA topoisomerase n=1 Tax=Thioalkalivibrio thiocyanodenitrificans TaxID=243063 RepID=UPI0003A0ED9D|nr:DNA topoisomerase [Thioalkalivibrio thiocyanodenitrificans]